jgi:predicted MPP superfamily phosphohydrolase
MKYIRLVSDLHLDFDIRAFNKTHVYDELDPFNAIVKQEGAMAFLWIPPALPEDSDTTLVIAGDLWDDRKFLRRKYSNGDSWLKRLSKQFKYVVFVLGNHDYWGANLTLEPASIRKELKVQEIENVHLLEIDTLILDNVKFVGGTMWTNYNRENCMTMLSAPFTMANDHNYIKIGKDYCKLKPEHLLGRFKLTKKHIFENCTKDNPEQKIVVVTHMAPSFRSIHDTWKNSNTNGYYYSDLDTELCYLDHDINYWFHGHTHKPMDYVMEESRTAQTRVVCNPRGYRGFEQTGFDPNLRFEV